MKLASSCWAAALALSLTFTAAAQDAPSCQSAERTAMYADYSSNRGKKNPAGGPDVAAQKYAYEVAQRYVEKYGAACADKYTDSVRKFMKAYEAATDRYNLSQSVYGATPDLVKAFEIGRRLLAATPGDLQTLMALAHSGDAAIAAKNEPLISEALASGKKALQEIESGKAITDWTPYRNREEAVSYLHYYVGNLAVANRETEHAIAWLAKAATLEGPAKLQPATYGRLAVAYHVGQLKPMQEAYNAAYAGKPETPEGVAAFEELNQVIDRIIDAYARAVSLAGDNPRYASAKPIWRESLQSFYKIRKGESMPDLDSYIASATTRSLPVPLPSKR